MYTFALVLITRRMVGPHADNLRFVDAGLACRSVGCGNIEHVFDESDVAARSMIARLCASGRAENRAAAEALVSIDNLYRLRCREDGSRTTG